MIAPLIKTFRTRIFLAVFVFSAALPGFSGSAEKLVALDAAKLAAGPLKAWPNSGTLGGRFIAEKTAPIVETVAGRKAVTFTGKEDFLRSTFGVPSALLGARPFTVAAWVFDPGIEGKKAIAAWSPGSAGAAEFGIGKGRNAAFYCSHLAKIGFEGGVPESGRWQHVAVVNDGAVLSVFLNGRMNARKNAVLDIKGGEAFFVGAGWNAARKAPSQPLAGSIALVEVHSGVLSPLEIWNLAGFREALLVAPGNGATVSDLKPALHWEVGDPATAAVNIFFGTRRADFEKADPRSSAFRTKLPAERNSFGPLDLGPGETYFWRIDGLDSAGAVRRPGEIWSFRVDAGAASEPRPRNGVAGVSTSRPELSWTPGRFAVRQAVYFSDSMEDVKAGKRPLTTKAKPAAGSLKVGRSLKPGTVYYWRISTDNGRFPDAPGEIWSFRTADKPDPDQVTFFITSDLHYGASVTAVEANRRTIDAMNGLAGLFYPERLGGDVIRTPRGFVLLGDLVDDGNAPDAAEVWSMFTADYGVNGEGRAVFPVYEGVGNHDGDPKNPPRQGILARNKLRPAVKNISPDGLHYSWDWGRVHFVQLNLFPGSAGEDIINPWGQKFQGEWKFPRHSLEFLKEDLAENVSLSGRPVVLFQHYGWDEWSRGWWSEGERAAFREAVRGFNIAGVFWGHSHAVQRIDWEGLPTWCVGSGNKEETPGEFFVVRITPGEMLVAERKGDRWGYSERVPLK